MKNIKLMVLATITMLFMGINNLNAQEKEPQTVIIRAYEAFGYKNSHMSVTSPDGSTKSIELSLINVAAKTAEDDLKNSIVIQSEINNWKKQGFIIDGISSVYYNAGTTTTIILSK